MAKFRQNHEKGRGADGWMGKISSITVLLIALLAGGFYGIPKMMDSDNGSRSGPRSTADYNNAAKIESHDRSFLPVSSNDNIVHHSYYSLAYNEKKEQADWVAYELTKASLQVKNVPRAKRFNEDPAVRTKSAKHSDYSHSGFTRGHLAPAGDMAFSSDAMRECFYMSNMSPQPRPFNNGIWKELEETTRDWAYKKDAVYVVTGPIFYDDDYETIGKKNKVGVPDAFYKIIVEQGTESSASFIIPNTLSNKHLNKYLVSIDEIEKQTGIDFFSSQLSEEAESKIDGKGWAFNESKYQQRINHWNKQ